MNDKLNDVVHIKLCNGEDLVSFISDTTEDTMTLEHPVALTRYKETGYQFVKWFPFSVNINTHVISTKDIVSFSDVEEAVKHNYILYAVQSKLTKNKESDLDFSELEEDLEDKIIH